MRYETAPGQQLQIGHVQRTLPGLLPPLGRHAAGLRAVPGRTKGKDERGVGYIKRNASAGHAFEHLEALHAHLARWMREIADARVHGTTGAHAEGRLEDKLLHFSKPKLLVVDELGATCRSRPMRRICFSSSSAGVTSAARCW
ncbi:hypothetical protein ACFPXO_04775 [Aquincola sp. GCM10022187]